MKSLKFLILEFDGQLSQLVLQLMFHNINFQFFLENFAIKLDKLLIADSFELLKRSPKSNQEHKLMS